jgi:predicted Fe-Mo cluster-binding NifX family protein
MRFAIPSDDQIHLTAHTGRTRGFVVYQVDDSGGLLPEYRDCASDVGCEGKHGQGDCKGPNGSGQSHGLSRHEQILCALDGCDAIVALGMGPRLQQFFAEHGIKVFFTRDHVVERVANQMLSNSIPQSDGIRPCSASHTH